MIMLDEFVNKRLEICKACPLYKETSNGPVCNPSKYISPDGKEWSYFKKEGWIKGCNCLLKNKTRGFNNQCIVKKW